jgi:hypothetical protein
MAASVISARLDLLVRLFDTTTGASVDERSVYFMRNGIPVRPESRGVGIYVFINTGREDFLMQIKVYGYEDYEKRVIYEELDERLPVCNVFLMPSESTSLGRDILSFSGTLPFLTEIEAVNLNKSLCMMGTYTTRTQTMTVFHPSGGRLVLDEDYYGLLSEDRKSYERIEVENMISPQSVKLKSPLKEEVVPNLPIARIVYGVADAEGNYLLRVNNNGPDTRYLVRYVVGEEVRFQEVDFNDQEDLQ